MPVSARSGGSLGEVGAGHLSSRKSGRAKQLVKRWLAPVLAVAIVVVTFVTSSHAARAAGLLDTIQANIAQQTTPWMDHGLTYAAWLFAVVAVTSAMITAVRYYSTNNTLEGLHYPLAEIAFRLITPFVLLTIARTLLPGIFGFASRLAGGITGIPITGPSAIYDLGIRSATALYSACVYPITAYLAANPIGAFTSLVTFSPNSPFILVMSLGLLGLMAGLSILLAFTLIAAELLVRTLNVFITLSIGAVQIGWSAGKGTEQFAAAYWSGVNQAVFGVVIIYAIASFIAATSATAFTAPANSTDLPVMFRVALNALGFSWASWYIVFKLPHLAESAFSGRPVMTTNDVVNTATAPVRGAAMVARGF